MNIVYKYIVSLEGQRYLLYYDLLSNDNNIIKSDFYDINLDDKSLSEGSLEEMREKFYVAINSTDYQFNHIKTIEYIKNDYMNQLTSLYNQFFNKYSLTIDGILFPLNDTFLHYYKEINSSIKNQISLTQFVNIDKQVVKWSNVDQGISFNKFQDYYSQIINFFDNKNLEFIQDKNWIANLDPLIDFSNEVNSIELSQELKNHQANIVESQKMLRGCIALLSKKYNILCNDDILIYGIDYLINKVLLLANKDESLKINELQQKVTEQNNIASKLSHQMNSCEKKIVTTYNKIKEIILKWTI
jgi:hypothetical protein